MRVRVRVTTSGGGFCGFCGFCGSVSQTVDIARFYRFLACGSRVVFACGFLGELVDLRSTVVVNGKSQRDLTTDSMLC